MEKCKRWGNTEQRRKGTPNRGMEESVEIIRRKGVEGGRERDVGGGANVGGKDMGRRERYEGLRMEGREGGEKERVQEN